MSTGLQTPKEFLDHVVGPDMVDFSQPGQADLRVAFHACTSLLSLRDWVAAKYDGSQWADGANTFGPIDKKTVVTFQNDLVAVEPNFQIIFDIANASKHMVLNTTRRMTAPYGAESVAIITTSNSTGGNTQRVVVEIATRVHDVLQCAESVHKAWKSLFAQNGW
jgi:hypothetical protein